MFIKKFIKVHKVLTLTAKKRDHIYIKMPVFIYNISVVI